MKMRQLKSWTTARQILAFYFMREVHLHVAQQTRLAAGRDLMEELRVAGFIPERGVVLRAEEPPMFQCVKVNGGEVVATFDSREEALALMVKHTKQRKAKLQVLNTSTGELELFSEEEAVS